MRRFDLVPNIGGYIIIVKNMSSMGMTQDNDDFDEANLRLSCCFVTLLYFLGKDIGRQSRW